MYVLIDSWIRIKFSEFWLSGSYIEFGWLKQAKISYWNAFRLRQTHRGEKEREREKYRHKQKIHTRREKKIPCMFHSLHVFHKIYQIHIILLLLFLPECNNSNSSNSTVKMVFVIVDSMSKRATRKRFVFHLQTIENNGSNVNSQFNWIQFKSKIECHDQYHHYQYQTNPRYIFNSIGLWFVFVFFYFNRFVSFEYLETSTICTQQTFSFQKFNRKRFLFVSRLMFIQWIKASSLVTVFMKSTMQRTNTIFLIRSFLVVCA